MRRAGTAANKLKAIACLVGSSPILWISTPSFEDDKGDKDKRPSEQKSGEKGRKADAATLPSALTETQQTQRHCHSRE